MSHTCGTCGWDWDKDDATNRRELDARVMERISVLLAGMTHEEIAAELERLRADTERMLAAARIDADV